MKKGITLLTPTTDRPDAFSRCEIYVDRQLRQPDQWIVADGGRKSVQATRGQDYVRVKPTDLKGTSIARNYLACLPLIKYSTICFFEDDDWYAPEYLQYIEENIKSYTMVGFFRNRYYNVRDRYYFVNGNFTHSSLCTTAMHHELLPTFQKIAKKYAERNYKFIDLNFWEKKDISKKLFRNNKLHVGIKGMPGRHGMAGHNYKRPYIYDKKGLKLRQWLPEEDYEYYKRFFQSKTPN